MLKRPTLISILLILVIASSGQQSEWIGYKVYNSFLHSLDLDSQSSVAIVSKLEIEKYSSDFVEAIKEENKQMIHFYTKAQNIDSSTLTLFVEYFGNQSNYELEAKRFLYPKTVNLLKKKSLERLFRNSTNQGWLNFYKKYPNSAGLFKFSKVYFSKDLTNAVFYYSRQQSVLKGWGDLVLMENINNQWKVKYQISLWQS